MMEGRPIKFRLLEIFNEGEKWNHEVVPQIQNEYGMSTRFDADSINFDIIEICTAGFIIKTETRIDTDGIYKPGSLLIRYKITRLGRDQFETLVDKVRKRKERA